MSDDDVRDEDEPIGAGSPGDDPPEGEEAAQDEAGTRPRTRSRAVPERPSRRKKAPPPRARGGRGARRRRFGVVHAVILVALVLLVARVATMVADDGPISGGTWASLAAVVAVLLIAVTNLLEQQGRLRTLRGRGLAGLGAVLALSVISVTVVLVTDSSPQLGLDLQGGYSVVLSPEGDPPSDTIDQAIEIIRQRIDGLGVAEPEITRQGDNVVVDLPGVRDREQAQEIVGRTAQLEFRPVRATALPFDAEAAAAGEDPCAAAAATVTGAVPPGEGAPPEGTPPGETTPEGSDPEATTPDGTAPEGTATTEAGSGEGAPATEEEGAPPLAGSSALTDGEHALGPLPRQEDTTTTTAPDDTTTTAPAGDEVPADEVPGDEAPADEVVLPTQADDDEPRSCVHMGPVGITGDALSKSQAQLGGTTGSEWVVAIRIEGGQQDAANALFNMCNAGDPASCPTRQMAIVLDEEVVSAPTVNEPNLASDEFVISGGRDETTGRGGFSEGEAKDLALVLRYGALPVEFATGAERQVSPTVGEDSLRAGVIAGLLGLGIVILYLLAYYRALGLIVVLGMAVWSALMYGVVTWLSSTQGLTLSLSGVVGIVISIGTTVDSYVVHFERLKDEVGLGKSVRSSTERGFQLAFRTILTANVAALIGAALLWWLTVGAVRGFAFFLGLSVLLDLFVIWTFERPMVALLARSRFFTEHRVFGVARGLGSRADRPAAAGAGALR